MIKRLIKYLPDFVKVNVELTALLTAISNALDSAKTEIVNIKNAYWSGKGLKLTADESNIFYEYSTAEAVIQTRLSNRFEQLTLRGSESGIISDLTHLAGSKFTDINSEVGLYGIDECGIIVDQTYLAVDSRAIIDLNKAVTINADFTDKEKAVTREKIVPIDAEIIYE